MGRNYFYILHRDIGKEEVLLFGESWEYGWYDISNLRLNSWEKEGLCMAKIERSINEDFDQLLSNIENGILNSSISATLEDASDFQSGTARCSVRIFERYSYAGGNRVSLNITLFQNGEDSVQLSAITAGGSQAVFFKINTLGEEAFLDKLIELLDV